MNFHFEVGRHVFYMFVIGISLLAVISNAYNPDLLLIEGPVRSQGAGGKAFIGFRMNSARNLSTAFSLIVEFFQIAHLSWTASRMDDHYNSFENLNSTQVGNVTRMYIAPTVRGVIPDNLPDATVSLAKYYLSIVAIVIWGVLYSLPAVVVNTTTGNRTLSTEMVEYYRLFLWGMSGPAFLTVLKSLTFAMFCTNDMDGDGTSDGEYCAAHLFSSQPANCSSWGFKGGATMAPYGFGGALSTRERPTLTLGADGLPAFLTNGVAALGYNRQAKHRDWAFTLIQGVDVD